MDQTTKVKLWMNTTSSHSIRFQLTKERWSLDTQKESGKRIKPNNGNIISGMSISIEAFVCSWLLWHFVNPMQKLWIQLFSFIFPILYRSDLVFNFHMNGRVLGPIPRRHCASDHGRMFFRAVPYYIQSVLFHVNWIRLGKIWQQRACMHTHI